LEKQVSDEMSFALRNQSLQLIIRETWVILHRDHTAMRRSHFGRRGNRTRAVSLGMRVDEGRERRIH
jgi:hypothetical protein